MAVRPSEQVRIQPPPDVGVGMGRFMCPRRIFIAGHLAASGFRQPFFASASIVADASAKLTSVS